MVDCKACGQPVDDGLKFCGNCGASQDPAAEAAGMAKERCVATRSHEEAAALVTGNVRSGDFVLVKGSRGMQMEKVIASLEEEES